MAMTKKEQAQFAAMQAEITRLNGLLKAAVKSEPVERDLKIPSGDDVIQGWDFNKHRTHNNVFKSWSKSYKHNDGIYEENGRASQNGRELFSTKLLALKAWRYEVEQDLLFKIALIDDEIGIAEG
jgi:hypothetical protein